MWPEVLANDTQVRQFPDTVDYCRMFMGRDYVEVRRPPLGLTRKAMKFHWHAVRKLKQLLIDFTTLQAPDTSEPFGLYTEASSYAIGAVSMPSYEPCSIEIFNL